jgi:hypothetical protein
MVCCFDYGADDSAEVDGGDILAALTRTQEALTDLTTLMKTLDDRLMMQEERVRWLQENNGPILSAFRRMRPTCIWEKEVDERIEFGRWIDDVNRDWGLTGSGITSSVLR